MSVSDMALPFQRRIGLLVLVTPLLASAQPSASPPQPPRLAATAPVTAETKVPVSNEVSSAVSAGIRYEPEKREAPEAPAVVPTRSEIEERNGVVELPRYIVESPRPPDFPERSIYTARGLRELAASRYLGSFHQDILSRFRISRADEAYALQLYADEERRLAIADNRETAALFRDAGRPAVAESIEALGHGTFIRQQYWGSPFSDVPTKLQNGR